MTEIRNPASGRIDLLQPCHSADVILPFDPQPEVAAGKIIFVGASTGGTEAIKVFLQGLPKHCPPVLVAQHMPEAFTKPFADRLNGLCSLKVAEAIQGEPALPGHAYIAPGHSHLLARRQGAGYFIELNQGPPVNRHRPSVDVLFRSAANCAGKNAVGVILTGMGKDGAQGMLEMKKSGAYNFAQSEASCVVFGMPKEAILSGGVDEISPLEEMARRVLQHLGVFR